MNKHTRVWSLQDAKARLSEVVKRAMTEGPQTVTVHGKVAVLITNQTALRAAAPSVDEIVTAFQSCPANDFEIPRMRTYGKFRNVDL